MLALYEEEINETKKFSLRYDNPTQTYYVFYYGTDASLSDLILSYDLHSKQWNVDTSEHKTLFGKSLNDFFYDTNLSFEEQVRYIINYLDNYFIYQSKLRNTAKDTDHHNTYTSSWLQHLRGMRRWASQDTVKEPAAVLQRYSAPEQSTSINNNVEIISVKALAESYYTNDFNRNRTKTITTPLQHSSELNQKQKTNKPSPITELWLNATTKQTSDFQKKIGNHIEEEKLKSLTEKFITYFGGTFQCNVGQQYQLAFDNQTWYFTVIKVEFLKMKNFENRQLPKTKIVLVVDGIPHYVRG
ncbi:unnamed protein product [Rotaria socialis]|uniref:Uncharacterized protein n=1 Tax=Rotaria socialis TaxID=392032 RepID=A0A817PJ19_9BILA|nr:unnamed protein product [Rotaria socialis]CAF3275779.1 unnamed protein product [Rotaria socialis]CAF3751441.1 unnamed protein product [Rotaria socialis]